MRHFKRRIPLFFWGGGFSQTLPDRGRDNPAYLTPYYPPHFVGPGDVTDFGLLAWHHPQNRKYV